MDSEKQAMLDKLVAERGITLTATFIPQSQSRHAGEASPTLNWKVTLKGTRGEVMMDYMQGIGHIPGYNHRLPRTLYFEPLKKAWDAASESGTYPEDPVWLRKHEHGQCWEVRPFYKTKPLPPPKLADILYSLLWDSMGTEDATFEEWCRELGYDTDSRKAEAIYRTCVENGIRFRRLIGTENMATVTTILEDY